MRARCSSAMADKFMAANPDVKVSVTPVDWGQAVAKLQTAIGGGETPDVSQMGTDMMGQFVETGALEPVPADIDPAGFFESAGRPTSSTAPPYGVPWYVETRVLYYRTDLAEKAGDHGRPDHLGRAQGDGQGHASRGWRRVRHLARNEELARSTCRSSGRTAVTSSAADGAFALDSPQAVEALTFYDSFFEEGLTPTTVPEGFDVTPAFVAGTHPMFFSGPWHVGLITEAGGADIEGKWAIAPMPKKTTGDLLRRWQQPRRLQGQPEQGRGLGVREVHGRPANQVAWYQEATVLPAVQSAWDDPALSGDENVAVFGEQLQDTKAPPAISTWNEVSTAINDNLEKVTTGDCRPRGRREVDGGGSHRHRHGSVGHDPTRRPGRATTLDRVGPPTHRRARARGAPWPPRRRAANGTSPCASTSPAGRSPCRS